MKNTTVHLFLTLAVFLGITLISGCSGTDSGKKSTDGNETKSQQQQQQQKQTSKKKNGDSENGSNGSDVLHRVNAGASKEYKTEDGEKWVPDKLLWKGEGNWGAEGGKTVDRGGIEIRNTSKDDIYRHERWGMPGYTFKVPNGEYKVRLHFAETYHGVETAGDRIFTVRVEGKDVLRDFDVFEEAGRSRQTAVVRTIKNVEVNDGELNIKFEFQKLTPLINGIEIIKNS